MAEPTEIRDLEEGVYPVPFLNGVFEILRALLPTSAQKATLEDSGGSVAASNRITNNTDDASATATSEGDVEILPKIGQKIRLFSRFRLTDETTNTIRSLVLRRAVTGEYENLRLGALFFGDSTTPFQTSIYDIAGGTDDKPGAGAVIARFVAPRAFALPAALAASRANAGAAATDSTVFLVRKNTVQIGTFTFAAGAMSATFAAASATNFAAGDVLRVVAPGAADATLADVSFTLAGVLS